MQVKIDSIRRTFKWFSLMLALTAFECLADGGCVDIFATTRISNVPDIFRTHFRGPGTPPKGATWSLAYVFEMAVFNHTYTLAEWDSWLKEVEGNPNWDVSGDDFPKPSSKMPDAAASALNLRLAVIAFYQTDLRMSSTEAREILANLIRESRSLQEKLPTSIRSSGKKFKLFDGLDDVQDYRFWTSPQNGMLLATENPLDYREDRQLVPVGKPMLHIFKGKKWKDHAYPLKSLKKHSILSVTQVPSKSDSFIVVSMPYQAPDSYGRIPEVQPVVISKFVLKDEALLLEAQETRSTSIHIDPSILETRVQFNESSTLVKVSFPDEKKYSWTFSVKMLRESSEDFGLLGERIPFNIKKVEDYAKHPSASKYAALVEKSFSSNGGTIRQSNAELQIWNDQRVELRIELPMVISRWIEEEDPFRQIENEIKWNGNPGKVTYSSRGNFILCTFFAGGVMILNSETGAFVDFVYQRRETRLWDSDSTPVATLDEESGILRYHGFLDLIEYKVEL